MGRRSIISPLQDERRYFNGGFFIKILPLVLAFMIMFLYGALNLKVSFRGDAYETWEVAKSLFDPKFAYRSFVEYRGFMAFFLMSLIYNLSVWLGTNDILTFRFFSSLIFSIMTTVSLPFLFSRVLKTEISVWKKIFFSGVVFYFYRDYFLHPSNDYLAFFFLVLSVNSMLKAGSGSRLWILSMALLLAAAISCRLNYILALPVMIVWLAADAMKTSRRWVDLFLNVGILILITGLLFVVEGLYKDYRNRTDGPLAFNLRGLVNVQLTYGLRYQRIEWGIGEAYQGPLYFWDDQGQAIFDKENIVPEEKLLSLRKYAGLFFKYPFDFLVIYFRHFFNGLDMQYPAIYVSNIYGKRVLFSFLNYTLLFLSLKVIRSNLKNWLASAQSISTISMLMIPAASSIPFVIEPRFFLPMTISLFSLAVFGLQSGGLDISLLFKRQILSWSMLEYIFFILVCFTLSSNTFLQAVDAVLLLSR